MSVGCVSCVGRETQIIDKNILPILKVLKLFAFEQVQWRITNNIQVVKIELNLKLRLSGRIYRSTVHI